MNVNIKLILCIKQYWQLYPLNLLHILLFLPIPGSTAEISFCFYLAKGDKIWRMGNNLSSLQVKSSLTGMNYVTAIHLIQEKALSHESMFRICVIGIQVLILRQSKLKCKTGNEMVELRNFI